MNQENSNLEGEEYTYDARDRQRYSKKGEVYIDPDGAYVTDNYPEWENTTHYDGSVAIQERRIPNQNEYIPNNDDYTLFYRGPDLGGGVAGINYACSGIGKELNYKHYNLRGDVAMVAYECSK